jgi:hypothetical protein
VLDHQHGDLQDDATMLLAQWHPQQPTVRQAVPIQHGTPNGSLVDALDNGEPVRVNVRVPLVAVKAPLRCSDSYQLQRQSPPMTSRGAKQPLAVRSHPTADVLVPRWLAQIMSGSRLRRGPG